MQAASNAGTLEGLGGTILSLLSASDFERFGRQTHLLPHVHKSWHLMLDGQKSQRGFRVEDIEIADLGNLDLLATERSERDI